MITYSLYLKVFYIHFVNQVNPTMRSYITLFSTKVSKGNGYYYLTSMSIFDMLGLPLMY